MIGDLIAITISCFAVGAVLMAVASRAVAPEVRRQRWLKFAGYFVVVHAVLACAALGRAWLLALTVAVLIAGAVEFGRALSLAAEHRPSLRWQGPVAYALVSAGVLFAVASLPASTFAFLYVVVATFDGFSQAVGQLLGAHRLAPAVSPNKTVEGLLGGLLGAAAVAWAAGGLADLATPLALAVGGAICLCGLAGDLSASWIKRRAGLKDFGALLRGQGGVLDRFDSFIAAGALVGPVLRAVSAT